MPSVSIHRATVGLVGLVAVLSLGVACKSAAPPTGPTTLHEQRPLGTAKEALEALDTAEARLLDEVAFGANDHDANDGSPPEATESPEGTRLSARGYGRCARACEALASMVRAADRLCAMTGEEEDRCRSARRRVDAARHIVEAHCPSCSL